MPNDDLKWKTSASTLVFVGALPPPVHGQSTVNQQVLDAVRAKRRVAIVDLSPRALRVSAAYYGRRLFAALAGVGVLLRHCREERRAIYMSVDSGLGLLLDSLLSGVGRFCGYSLFLHHHSYAYVIRKSTLMNILKTISIRDARHIFLCEDMRARYEDLYGSTTAPIICPNGRFAANGQANGMFRADGDAIRIGLLSNLFAEKGLYDFIAILDRAEAEGLDVQGVLAGPPLSEIEAQAIEKAKQRLGARLAYLGPVHGEAKQDFFNLIDVFVFPTHYPVESFGLVIVEALARGKPVIAYGRGCIASYLQGPAGVVVDLENDFVASALPVLLKWRSDPDAYRVAAEAASRLSQRLRQDSDAGFGELIDALAGAATASP